MISLVVGVLILAAAVLGDPVIVSPPYLFGEEPPSPDVLAASYGYDTETHVVESSGYLLTLFRIRRTNQENTEAQEVTTEGGRVAPSGPSEPFILQHGLAGNAAQWVMFGQHRGLAYTLADSGFDVWLASGRGSKYGKKHKTFSASSDSFWDFSWHEQGLQDLPAVLDFVVNATGYSQAWYAGHSMGTTMMFVMNALRPEYSNRVKHHFALAPTAFLGRASNQMVVDFKSRLYDVVRLWQSMGVSYISPESPLMYSYRAVLCAAIREMCKQTFFYDVFGVDELQGFPGQAEITGAYLPGDFSTRQVIHFGQNAVRNDVFKHFDYGPAKNRKLYNSPDAPDYDVSNITVPTTFLYAESDKLTVPQDVVSFSKRFTRTPPRLHLVPFKQFNHADFISAREQKKYVHDVILAYVGEIRTQSGLIPRHERVQQARGAGAHKTLSRQRLRSPLSNPPKSISRRAAVGSTCPNKVAPEVRKQ